MESTQLVNKIISELKRNKKEILAASIYNTEQSDIIEDIILDVTGSSADTPNFYDFKNLLQRKLGLYDDDTEDNVISYQVAVKLGCVVPFEGWKSGKFYYQDIVSAYNKIDGSNVEDIPFIIDYLKKHGIIIPDYSDNNIYNYFD